MQLTLKGVKDTSIISYYELLERPETLNTNYTSILLQIWKSGPLTDQEITHNLSYLDPNHVRPRRNELADPDRFAPPLLTAYEKRMCRVTGKTAYTWQLTPQGFEIVKMLRRNNNTIRNQ